MFVFHGLQEEAGAEEEVAAAKIKDADPESAAKAPGVHCFRLRSAVFTCASTPLQVGLPWI